MFYSCPGVGILNYSRLALVIAGLICLVFIVHSQDDPAIREMENAMDTPGASVQNLTGSWHLELMNGVNINLSLSQSGRLVSGQGNVTSGNASQEATANGSYSGGVLKMNVFPVNGTEHYALSLDLSGQTPAKTYRIFSNNTATSSGTVRRVSYTTRL
jgi:hypothetical protein